MQLVVTLFGNTVDDVAYDLSTMGGESGTVDGSSSLDSDDHCDISSSHDTVNGLGAKAYLDGIGPIVDRLDVFNDLDGIGDDDSAVDEVSSILEISSRDLRSIGGSLVAIGDGMTKEMVDF